ncbi:ASCH domain-containing protein [Nakamurella silvestris]|nr:ASCH domain-containing protein [Nakamurella silvestris]
MRALTVRQPWATLLVAGIKRMETRSWDTKFRGTLAIHAGLAMPCRIGQTIELGGITVERDRSGLLLRGHGGWPYRLPVGAIVGTVDLFQTRSTSSGEHGPDDRERALGDHGPGRWAWSTSSARNFGSRAISCPGRLGLWIPPADVLVKIANAAAQ